jgi:chemotaxis family two-component system response regulator Rcp1
MSPIHILLVEDNEGDIILTMEALKEGRVKNKISIARDGEQAIMFLNKQGAYAGSERPDMILLDINLPRVDGKEVLSYIKNSAQLKAIPVVMLTTSTSEKDILEAYKNYANCYISKPVNLNKFFEVVQKIEDFWISIVHLPKNV